MNFVERTSLQVFVSIFLLSALRCCLWLPWPCAVVRSGFAEIQALEGLEITHWDPAHRPALPANPAPHYTDSQGGRTGLSATLPVTSFPVQIKLHKC